VTQEYTEYVAGWLKGHRQAVDFIRIVFDILHVCDDLTDRDVTVSTVQVQQAFLDAMITLPRNVFYVEHFVLLNGALQTAILNWHAANRMELTDVPHAKEVAFVLRSSYVDLVTLCAWIIGGQDWSVQVAYEARLHASREGFETYRARLTQERRHSAVVEVAHGMR